MTANQIAYWSLQEDKRSHLVNELETHRSNKAREVENERHNISTETETSRHNLSTESETRRSNIAKENLQERSILENVRHNKAGEMLQDRKISNDYSLGLESNSIARQRNNLESKKIDYDYTVNLSRNAETSRHNKATEAENVRHNTIQDHLGVINAGNNVVSTALKVALPSGKSGGMRFLNNTSGRRVPFYGSK